MLRVLLLSTDLQKGGYPLRLVRLAGALRPLDIVPIVGCLAPPGPLTAVLSAQGIETFDCGARGPWDLMCLRRLARVVAERGPDVVHAGLFHANIAARLVGRMIAACGRRMPVITSTVTIEIERRWHGLLEALSCEVSDLHIANSPAVRDHLVHQLGFPPGLVRVVPNGIDLAEIDAAPPARRHELGIPDSVPLVAWVGRMDPVKGLTTFVEMLRRLRTGDGVAPSDCRGILLGDGPERGAVERAVRAAGLERAVTFAGWRDDVVRWLKAADVLVLPSRTEGSPNVVLEAMAARCPVVASDIAACRDLIEPGRSGALCPPDDPAGFARAVSMLLANPDLRRRFMARSRARVEAKHDLPAVARTMAELYGELVDS